MHTFRNDVKEYGALSEKQMVDLITYYFPNTDIERDKYVYNIRCSLWDKQMDVHTALIQMKESLRTTMEMNQEEDESSKMNENTPIYATTVYDAYVWYCKYYSEISTDELTVTDTSIYTTAIAIPSDKRKTKTAGKRPIVSKSYFEKYVNDTICDYVVDEKYILREWLDSNV